MGLKWTDTLDIAEALIEARPDQDPTQINFVDLMQWVMALPDFDDDPKRCGERILEAIQQCWIDEK
jgi:FeS assembly protein IscX